MRSHVRVEDFSTSQAATYLVGLATIAGALLSPDPLMIGACGLALAVIMKLLWTLDEPPILLLPCLYQWSEVATWPLATLWKQVPLNTLSTHSADLESAALYGLAAIVVFAASMKIGSGKGERRPFAARLLEEAGAWEYNDVSVVAFTAIGVGYGAAFLGGINASTRELFNQISNIKYVGLFALTYWCLIRRTKTPVLWAVIAFEVMFGMTGFFAEFKNSILTFLIAAIAAKPKLKGSHIAAVSSVAVLLVIVGIVWSEVKPNYRAFVNQGSGEQVVLEPLDKRLAFLSDEIGSIDSEKFAEGFDRLVNRHGYIEYLAVVMRNVPASIPHEDGQLTLAVLRHISMPRFLFPDKPVLPSDTEVTIRYTALPMTTGSGAASVSIGYLGELYIDFGVVGSLTALVVIGLLIGFAYRNLRDKDSRPTLLVAGLCLMIVLSFAYFGQAYAKNVGGTVFSVVIALLARRFWLPFVAKSRLNRKKGSATSGTLRSPAPIISQ